jgi:hypothetical protein
MLAVKVVVLPAQIVAGDAVGADGMALTVTSTFVLGLMHPLIPARTQYDVLEFSGAVR